MHDPLHMTIKIVPRGEVDCDFIEKEEDPVRPTSLLFKLTNVFCGISYSPLQFLVNLTLIASIFTRKLFFTPHSDTFEASVNPPRSGKGSSLA